MYKIYMFAMGHGGHGDESIKTEAVFTKEQAIALESLLRFVVDNACKEFWVSEVMEGE